MATIAGVTVTFALPENDKRPQNDVIARASDASFKFYQYRASDRLITIPLRGLSLTTKNSLLTALEADADKTVTIAPDSHVDLGAGAGTSITAKWIDREPIFTKSSHEFWSGELNFVRVT